MTAAAGGTLRRLAAFTTAPGGGNPAGVWIGERFPDAATMQAIATEVGYSETVFAVPGDEHDWTVRYFSPVAEVPFCGHATIALGVALGTGGAETARYRVSAPPGEVGLTVQATASGPIAELTSVTPTHMPAPPDLVATALDLLGWRVDELDDTIPPAVAFAGAHHLVLAVTDRATLTRLDYDGDRLAELMLAHDLTTLQLVWRAGDRTFDARNPFPVGGVVEDPATGAAAAALGGYLRDAGLLDAPATITIHQGDDMGRPSELTVTVPPQGGVAVAGHAVALDG